MTRRRSARLPCPSCGRTLRAERQQPAGQGRRKPARPVRHKAIRRSFLGDAYRAWCPAGGRWP